MMKSSTDKTIARHALTVRGGRVGMCSIREL